MPMRLRVILIIVSSIIVVIGANLLLSLRLTEKNLRQTSFEDMRVVADVVNLHIAKEMADIRAAASETARRAAQSAQDDGDATSRALARLLAEKDNRYLSLALFRGRRLIGHAGSVPAPPGDAPDAPCLDRALGGERVISTSRPVSDGEVVFDVFVPAQEPDLVLAATLPGGTFSEIIKPFRIWKSGNVFVDDQNGVVLGNIREEWVSGRTNFARLMKDNPQHHAIGSYITRLVAEESGKPVFGEFTVAGVPRLCVGMRIPVPERWVVGVVAPISESPIADARRGLLATALVFVGLGVLVALFGSGRIARQMTTIEMQRNRLAELKEEAEAASRAKSSFLANTSHEMRTPLNAIIGLAELQLNDFAAKKAEPEARENLEKIYSSGMTLLSIINDLLDISKIESGRFELVPMEYDPPSMINDTVLINVLRLGEKPVKFILEVDETIPSRLFGDELRVKQVFNNLLSNAIKYTPEGSVTWKVGWERDGDKAVLVSSVRDTGIGIKPEELKKLFTDYIRADTYSNRNIQGTGLGLSIVKKMTEVLGGSVSVDSVYGEGSVFTVRIPQEIRAAAPIGKAAVENLMKFSYGESRNLSRFNFKRISIPYARVLVVDDARTNLVVAGGMLRAYGMTVDCVSSGAEAVAALRKGEPRYDAVFMDHMMPEMDGVEATRIIREEIGTEYAKTVPVIALTANAIVGNEAMFLSKGFDAFVSKPIDVMRLDQVVRQWVRKKDKESPASAT